MDNISSDAKVEIYESLRRITGFEVNNYLYSKRNYPNIWRDDPDDGFKEDQTPIEERLKIIKALQTGKMLIISACRRYGPIIKDYLIEYTRNGHYVFGYKPKDPRYGEDAIVAPYALFRNFKSEIYLAFYAKKDGTLFTGFFRLEFPIG